MKVLPVVYTQEQLNEYRKDYFIRYLKAFIVAFEGNMFASWGTHQVVVEDCNGLVFRHIILSNKGLCGNLEFAIKGAHMSMNSALSHIYEKWPLYSGHDCYPINPNVALDSSFSFAREQYHYFKSHALYDLSREYGRHRLDLLKFITSELETGNYGDFLTENYHVDAIG